MPAGRPSDYKEEYCQLAIDLMSKGASITEVAAKCGASKQTIYNWMDQFPQFFDSIKKEWNCVRRGGRNKEEPV